MVQLDLLDPKEAQEAQDLLDIPDPKVLQDFKVHLDLLDQPDPLELLL
jgi:hypothetical protein